MARGAFYSSLRRRPQSRKPRPGQAAPTVPRKGTTRVVLGRQGAHKRRPYTRVGYAPPPPIHPSRASGRTGGQPLHWSHPGIRQCSVLDCGLRRNDEKRGRREQAFRQAGHDENPCRHCGVGRNPGNPGRDRPPLPSPVGGNHRGCPRQAGRTQGTSLHARWLCPAAARSPFESLRANGRAAPALEPSRNPAMLRPGLRPTPQ